MMSAERFNKLFPVGTAVNFFPIIGGEGFDTTETRSEAWELGHGEPVVKVKGRTGGVCLEAIETICPDCGASTSLEMIHGCG